MRQKYGRKDYAEVITEKLLNLSEVLMDRWILIERPWSEVYFCERYSEKIIVSFREIEMNTEKRGQSIWMDYVDLKHHLRKKSKIRLCETEFHDSDN